MPDIFVNETPIPKEVPKTEVQKAKFKGHSHSFLSTYTLYPDKANFETLENDEKIVLLLRQHIIVNVRWVIITGLLLLVPSFTKLFGIFDALPAGFGIVYPMIWYLITIAYALENFLSWYFNVYFVTDRRIIDVDFYNLIYKQVSDAQLSKIEDVTYNMGGVIRTLFNYGNVFIQTAAEVNQFEFLAVPQPDKVAKIIQDLMTP